MAFAYNVSVGDTVEIEHREHGHIGTVRVEHKYGRTVRLIFDMPRSVLVRVMNHRANGITFGLLGEPQAPLKGIAV